MYIRTRDEALQYLASILDLPDRRDQLTQSTVCTLLCLEVEPRLLLADCQALLIEGGLETLRARRRDVLGTSKALPPALLEPPFEEVASALDAIHFCGLIRQVLPELRGDRWQIARTLLLYESGVRTQIIAAVRARGNPVILRAAREAVEGMIEVLRPAWGDRLGAIRTACLEALKGSEGVEPDQLHETAEQIFELIALWDHRASELLEAIDGGGALAEKQIATLRELAAAARAIQSEPPSPPPGDIREVA
jgi:hypothetical protein